MLEDYLEEQPIVTNLLLKSFKNKKIVQAYLLTAKDKIFLLDYAKSFSKKLITENYDQKICNLIDENNYPELKIIKPTNDVIKKEELSNLLHKFNVKPVLGERLVYIIDGADKLNSSSANTILKFLEEPSDDIVAILLTDNINKVLPTIKSRCQIMNFKSKETQSIENIYNQYVNYREEYTLDDFYNNVNDAISLIKLCEKQKLNVFYHYKQDIFDKFKTKDDISILFDIVLYFYYDILNLKLQREIVYFNSYLDDIKEVAVTNNIDVIEDKIKLIQDIKIKLGSNMNLKSLMDYYIINFSEV